MCVQEARRFGKPYNLRIAAALGGMNKHEQFKDLKAGSEAAVATPGRLIDLLQMGALTMKRCTFLVFDEADRMFDLGFEPQVQSLPLPVVLGVKFCVGLAIKC